MINQTLPRLALTCGLAFMLAPIACTIPTSDPTGGEEEFDDSVPYYSALTGNGAPSGSHFTLNLIGVSNPKSASLTGNNGSRMFVPLSGSTKVMLAEGDFKVIDANATDGMGSFQLPNPDPENDGTTTYSVFARALGKPGGSSKTTTCAQDADGATWCSVYSAVAVREGGRTRFANVSRELLYVYVDTDGDGTLERYNLFNDALQDYYWQYDNSGLKLLQLRFYQVPTTVQ